MQRTVYAVLALAVLTTVLAGCTGVPGLEETEQFDRTVAMEPGSGIVVINRNGNVAVTVREGNDVGITAVKRSVYGRGELDKARIEVTEGDPLRVETVHTGFNPRVSVDYTISLPPTVVLQRIESSNGGIKLAGVRVTETELLTSNGRVIVDGAPGGDLAATSSNGRIELSGVEGYVTATTSNAGITVEDCGGVAGLSTSNGAISTEISAIRGDVTVSSSNAGITLRFAEDLDARLAATTSNGRIAVHGLMLRLEESTGTSVSGTLGNGGPTVTVTTSNAGIDLFGP
ncbi:hypothetical protein L21_0491 [Methanoculleus chikugoensis]|jgi:DUF4097 and DUF4098 domain-containing protein YvlB|uniref:DUF4097 domain-containing protein n=1 Tax=Methanoculleus chikugoensis TaxID=118126 RepID=A0A1M4MI61_9EURY|nr:DUF4097 family beta strand repeat-containing protein [Methanoculleus chikugoensis]MDD4566753.1 DUF4097 family beta strand repeat-containing protein [Methanoculleus chikugoensis]NMA11240.1 DUF4097 domain-containing protein [Methanomicrobiales archaeon]SCL74611.1 hypothetical protein L21_0491 [Methanoculleus chikugoensis]